MKLFMSLLCLLCLVAEIAYSAPSPKPTPNCVVRTADIGIILDASSSVDANEWEQMLEFATNLVGTYEIGRNKVRVALMTFNSKSTVVFDFNKYGTKKQIVDAIKVAVKKGSGTYTHLALDMAKNDLFQTKSGMRNGAPNLLFVITDGGSYEPKKTRKSAENLHSTGVTVFAVGIAGAIPEELKAIASKPELVYKYNDFSNLATIQDSFSQKTCKVAVKLAPSTTTPSTTIPSTTTPSPSCELKSADIAFLIDASGSVDKKEWRQSLNFASAIVKSYDVGKDRVRFALLVYSGTSTIVFDFNKYTTVDQLTAAIAKAPKENTGTNTHVGLEKARNELFLTSRGMRSNAPNILFVITDGQSNIPAQTIIAARALHQKGVTVFAIGVKGAKISELKVIASNDKLVYSYNDFTKLRANENLVNREACKVAVKLTPPTTTPVSGCVVMSADIGIILDASSSLDDTEWKQAVQFAKNLVNRYDIGRNNVRVALIVYSDNATLVFDFNNYTTKADVSAAIDSAPRISGSTATNLALDMAREELFQVERGMRYGVPNLLFVITDGSSNSGSKTNASAKALHHQGVTVVAVGVGQTNPAELLAIASTSNLTYTYANFDKLISLQDQFSKDTCKVAVSLPPPTLSPTECVVRSADIGIILDASGSVDDTEWQQSVQFAKNLVNRYDIGKDKVRVALIAFSTQSNLVFDFNNYKTKAEVLSAIGKAPKSGGSTATHLALNMAKEQMFQRSRGMRDGVPNFLFVVTDGSSNSLAKTTVSAKALHSKGITVYAVGVGPMNKIELDVVASNLSLVSSYENFDALTSLQEKFSKDTCKDVVRQEITTTPRPQVTAPPCDVKSADIGIILDASGSVSSAEWKQSIDFAADLVQSFDIGKSQVRVGLIVFSSTSNLVFDFNKFTKKSEIIAAIKKAPKISGGTNTHSALIMARDKLFQVSKGMRIGVPNLLIVITDGKSSSRHLTVGIAKTIHDEGITVFAVGVGGADMNELRGIASNTTLAYQYIDYNTLVSVQAVFTTDVCKVADKWTPPPPPVCPAKAADIAFLIDASGSIGPTEWKESLDFASEIVKSYNVGQDKVRFALLVYSETSTIVFDFNDHSTAAQVVAAISKAPKENEHSNTHLALDKVRDQLFKVSNGMRPDIPNILFVITDGQSINRPATIMSAKALHRRGVTVFTVGLKGAKYSELLELASEPKYAYFYSDYEQLQAIEDHFINETCKVTTSIKACICKDAVSDCANYSPNICYEKKYRKFAEEKCAAHCDLCKGGCTPVHPQLKPCVDKISTCNLTADFCTNLAFRPQAIESCPKFCSLCPLDNATRITQPPINPLTSPPTTVALTTSKFVPCDAGCFDKLRNCKDFDKASCTNTLFAAFLTENCKKYCGLCTPKAECLCKDKLDCSSYDAGYCKTYKDWAKEYCPVRCGLCPGLTVPAPDKCSDKRDCSKFQKSDCTNTAFKDFMQAECKDFCSLCGVSP